MSSGLDTYEFWCDRWDDALVDQHKTEGKVSFQQESLDWLVQVSCMLIVHLLTDLSQSQEPEVTSLTKNMNAAVDYIFYSSDSLQPLGVLKTLDKAVVQATGGLPAKDIPSDHISMKAVLSFTN